MQNNKIFSGHNAPVVLADRSFDSFVRDDKLSVIDFWAAWCGPCRYLSPVIDELSGEYKDSVKFGKVNVDENPLISRILKIESIPTVMFFKNGKLLDKSIGVVPKEVLNNKIKKFL
ncbi:MAG: thioredoxin [Ferroplasma sp.]